MPDARPPARVRPLNLARVVVEQAARLCLARPACMLPAAGGELIQHGVEWHLGMFRIGDGIAAGREHTVWLLFGAVKAGGFIATALLVRRLAARPREPDGDRGVRSNDLLAVLIGLLAPLYLAHYRLVAGAVGTRSVTGGCLLVVDAAIVALMAVVVGTLLATRRHGRAATEKR